MLAILVKHTNFDTKKIENLAWNKKQEFRLKMGIMGEILFCRWKTLSYIQIHIINQQSCILRMLSVSARAVLLERGPFLWRFGDQKIMKMYKMNKKGKSRYKQKCWFDNFFSFLSIYWVEVVKLRVIITIMKWILLMDRKNIILVLWPA